MPCRQSIFTIMLLSAQIHQAHTQEAVVSRSLTAVQTLRVSV
jgi:hypothetical protein